MESNNISKVDLDELRKNNTPKSQIVNSNKIDNSMSNKSNVYSDNYDWSKNSTIEKSNKTVDNYKISYVDFSKIYTNKYDALDGNNPVKISDSTKQLWLNGEATFKTNPDGSVLISVNGVPYGWTTASILNANMESDLKETENKNSNNQNTSNSETKTEKITVDDLLNTPPAQQNANTNVNDNSNQTVNENPTVKKNIGATVATLGAGIAEGAADTAEKGLHGLAAMGAAIATPFTGAFDIATGKHATKGMWDQVGDLMMENKVKDSWDSVYNKEISDVKDKTYGFNATRAVGNFGGGMIVGAALSGGLSAAASAPSTTASTASAGTEVAVSGPTAVAETSQAASAGTEVAVSSQTASQAASAGQNVARIESAVTNGAASGASTAGSAASGASTAGSAASGASTAGSAASGASTAGSAASGASSLVGKSGTSYSSVEKVLSAVEKGDVAPNAARKFIVSMYGHGGEAEKYLAKLGNIKSVLTGAAENCKTPIP